MYFLKKKKAFQSNANRPLAHRQYRSHNVNRHSDRQIDTTENITFSQATYASGKNVYSISVYKSLLNQVHVIWVNPLLKPNWYDL